jgi:hypothetical protein
VSTSEDYDYASQPIPTSWTEAAAEAPESGHQRRRKKSEQAPIPEVTSLDMFTACLAAVAAAIFSGFMWYEAQMRGATSPWFVVLLGIAIAVAVRVGGGREDPNARAVLSLMVYLATSSLIIFLVARVTYLELYGSRPGLTDFEQELLHSKLTGLSAIAAWITGGVAATIVSRVLR